MRLHRILRRAWPPSQTELRRVCCRRPQRKQAPLRVPSPLLPHPSVSDSYLVLRPGITQAVKVGAGSGHQHVVGEEHRNCHHVSRYVPARFLLEHFLGAPNMSFKVGSQFIFLFSYP